MQAPADQLTRWPDSVDAASAAALPMSGLTAYQYVDEHGLLEGGERVLINGAAGGVGHLALQLAKTAGCSVTAVASGRHRDFVLGLGADAHLDYTTTDVREAGQFDVVWDMVGGTGTSRLTDLVRDGGTMGSIFFGDYDTEALASRDVRFVIHQVHSDGSRLGELAAMVAGGQLRVAIDSTFDLREAAAAHARAERGHIQGKIVLAC